MTLYDQAYLPEWFTPINYVNFICSSILQWCGIFWVINFFNWINLEPTTLSGMFTASWICAVICAAVFILQADLMDAAIRRELGHQ